MQPFTIINKIDKSDYVNLILKKSYKNPVTIIMTIIGGMMLLFAILSSLSIIQPSYNNTLFQFIFGFFVLTIPFITKIQAAKMYDNTPKLHRSVQYTFADSEINCKGNDFSSTFSWDTIIKTEEIGKFLLLYTGKNVAEILNKDVFTSEQLGFIITKVYRKMI